MYENPDISYLFEPRGIAIIGASRDQSKIGHKFVQNIAASGYKGKVYPVNPEGGEPAIGLCYRGNRRRRECWHCHSGCWFPSSAAKKGVQLPSSLRPVFEIGNTVEEKDCGICPRTRDADSGPHRPASFRSRFH
jgi:hypothetical protein